MNTRFGKYASFLLVDLSFSLCAHVFVSLGIGSLGVLRMDYENFSFSHSNMNYPHSMDSMERIVNYVERHGVSCTLYTPFLHSVEGMREAFSTCIYIIPVVCSALVSGRCLYYGCPWYSTVRVPKAPPYGQSTGDPCPFSFSLGFFCCCCFRL